MVEKTIRRPLVLLLSLVFLVFLILGIFSFTPKEEKIEIVSLKNKDFHFVPFEKDDVFYYVLPSGMDFDDLAFSHGGDLLFEKRVINDEPLSFMETDKVYELNFNGKSYKAILMTDHDVPSVYIDLKKKDLEYLNADKTHRLDALTYLIDTDGNVINNAIKGTIKGRGNNSWNLNKKAYNLNFEEDVDVLGMGKADKWALVSNAMDPTLLYNKTVYELAKEVGLEWTPESRYVNVFLDGKYNGLYLICEKVEIDKERLNVGKNNILLKRELPERLEIVDNGFLTKQNNVIEITSPSKISSFYKEEVVSKVQQMEDAIFDVNSNNWKDVIDIDSWAKCYLIDEIFDNFDSGIASAYFYTKDDGLFYRGPIWDYDAIMFDTPYSIIANTHQRQPYSVNDYYYYLYSRPEFKERILELFAVQFKPLVREFIENKIDLLFSQIENARKLDASRWSYDQGNGAVEKFKEYLDKKIAFLDEYWNNEDKYHKILIQKETFYLTYMVEDGKTIKDAFDIDMSLVEENDYYYAESGLPFGMDDKIENDVILHYDREGQILPEEGPPLSRFGILNVAFLLIFILMFVIIFIRNVWRLRG